MNIQNDLDFLLKIITIVYGSRPIRELYQCFDTLYVYICLPSIKTETI